MKEWRVGNHVPINVYDGDRPVCQCHNEEDAKAIVDAVNKISGIKHYPESWLLEGEPYGKVILVHVSQVIGLLPGFFEDDEWLEVQKTIRDCSRKLNETV
jgi:hypothetical protein